MPRPTAWPTVVAALALVAAGCLGSGTTGDPGEATAERHARIHVANEDDEVADLVYQSLFGEHVVHRRDHRLGANESAALTLRYPGHGNVVLRVTHQGTGKSWEAAIAAASCDRVNASVALVDGLPQARDLRCGGD